MDPFAYLQNRMNQLWREFDREFAPLWQRINAEEGMTPMITAGPASSQALSSTQQPGNQSLTSSSTGPLMSSAWSSTLPSIRLDVRETPKEIMVTADLPGFPKDAIKATVDEGGMLSIRADKKEDNKGEMPGEWAWRERHSGMVQRMVQLPPSIDTGTAAVADFQDGVLQLKFAKKPEKTGRAIEIK